MKILIPIWWALWVASFGFVAWTIWKMLGRG